MTKTDKQSLAVIAFLSGIIIIIFTLVYLISHYSSEFHLNNQTTNEINNSKCSRHYLLEYNQAGEIIKIECDN